MYTNVSVYDFIDTFRSLERMRTEQGGEGNFSYQGLHALFNYLEEWEDHVEPLEFDPIALCCQFSEFDGAIDAVRAIDSDAFSDIHDALREDFKNGTYSYLEVVYNDKLEEACNEWLTDRTVVIEFGGGPDYGIIIDSEF